MLNQLVNEKKEKLIAYVEGSYMLPFKIRITAEIADGKYLLALLNGVEKTLRIKRLTLMMIPKDTSDPTCACLSVNIITANGILDGTAISPIAKSPSMAASTISKCHFKGDHADGLGLDDLSDEHKILYHPFRRSMPMTQELKWDVSKSLDPKDHIIIPTGKGLGIAFNAMTISNLTDQDAAFGCIEWDEL